MTGQHHKKPCMPPPSALYMERQRAAHGIPAAPRPESMTRNNGPQIAPAAPRTSFELPEAEAFFARRHYLRDISDERLLATRLSTSPVFLEEQSLPGGEGWQQVSATVRRPGGPGAVLAVDEVSRALLAGCRGQVPLGALLELLAGFHGVEPDALAVAAIPVVREAIGRGILYEAT